MAEHDDPSQEWIFKTAGGSMYIGDFVGPGVYYTYYWYTPVTWAGIIN